MGQTHAHARWGHMPHNAGALEWPRPTRAWEQWRVAVRDGVVWRTGLEDPVRGGGLSGLPPTAGSKRRARPGPRDAPGRDPTRALEGSGVSVAVGGVSNLRVPGVAGGKNALGPVGRACEGVKRHRMV